MREEGGWRGGGNPGEGIWDEKEVMTNVDLSLTAKTEVCFCSGYKAKEGTERWLRERGSEGERQGERAVGG